MGASESPRAGRALAGRPAQNCSHANREEFYNWRSYRAAVHERDTMARNPHYARLYVSEVYRGVLGGWAWTVCWRCGPGPG
jgi:hypothetical protein